MSAIVLAVHLAVTLILVVLALWSGRRGIRRMHYTMAILAVIALLLTVRQAGLFGEEFLFDATRLRVHLFFAISSLVSLPGVAYSGLALRTRVGGRTAHRRWVVIFLSLLILAFATAGWMFGNATGVAG